MKGSILDFWYPGGYNMTCTHFCQKTPNQKFTLWAKLFNVWNAKYSLNKIRFLRRFLVMLGLFKKKLKHNLGSNVAKPYYNINLCYIHIKVTHARSLNTAKWRILSFEQFLLFEFDFMIKCFFRCSRNCDISSWRSIFCVWVLLGLF